MERLFEELELEGEGVKGVMTTGVTTLAHQAQAEKELPESEHTQFRGLAARAIFLAADMPDIIDAAKGNLQFHGQAQRAGPGGPQVLWP